MSELTLAPDTLIHYGVKGMKWGVRNDRDRIGRSKKSRTPEEQAARKRRRNLNLAKAAAAGVVIASDPMARHLIGYGARFVASRGVATAMRMNAAYLQKRYGAPPEVSNAITAGLEFTKRRFGRYNITSL